jgi:hypothetical protein
MDFLKDCIEGKWIEDADGTWVYMMPKLHYYINFVIIVGKDRSKIKPDLCDLEWIFFTYFLGMDGFSGFEGDDEITCNRLVERYEKSVDVNLTEVERDLFKMDDILIEQIPAECYSKATGKFKKFIDPWIYLTRTYLIDKPRGPLGLPLYQNQPSNGFILGARGIRKSFTVYMGDFLHEWHFSGIKRYSELSDVNKPLLFAMGSGSKDQMQRTINNIAGFYDNQPGKYRFDDQDIPDWLSPFYKNYQGKLEVGKTFQHVLKGKGNVNELFGSTCQISVIRPDRTKIVAGDRFKRVYIEEVGFIEYIEEVFSSNIDSLRLEEESVGSWIATGTGGDMEAIRGSKEMFEKPKAYDIFSIPYYWKGARNKIGLFIPAQYQHRNLDDGNGFIYLDLASEEILKKRKQWKKTLDSVNYGYRIMYNPINPDEMLIPNALSILPKKEAQLRLNEIIEKELDKRYINVGEIVYDLSYPRGVRFKKDIDGKLNPIEKYNVDFSKINREGAFVMYEPPPEKIPDNMYWVVYDPAAQSGEGTSLHSVIVYKHFLSSDGKNWRDTIVAEWVGRKIKLTENFEDVIRIARFFNAKIFPEINNAGFVEWCDSNKYYHMLQSDSYKLQKEISPGSKRSHYKKGVQMTGRLKWWGLQKLTEWLLEIKDTDPKTGIPIARNIDYIYSKRLLNEIIYFNETDNFDHISSMIVLMVLITQLDNFAPSSEEELDEDGWDDPYLKYKKKTLTRRRSKLENYLL